MKEKPSAGSPFFGAFPSDCMSKATKQVNVHFFIHSSNSSNRNESRAGGGGGLKLARRRSVNLATFMCRLSRNFGSFILKP